MRSSIACIRCRRSKVKCVNSGVGTTCKSCAHSGRECSYPSPVTGGARRRDSLPGRPEGSADGEKRQRPRKSTHSFVANPLSGSRESPRPLHDALDPRLLTPTVWQELFEIFQIHYSADLPFLHPPTFLKPLHRASIQAPGSTASAAAANGTSRPPASPEFLLAFLALSARFHPKLVEYHSPPTSTRASNPLVASEYYAAAAHERLAGQWTDNHVHGLQLCQALLMLGLHEWGMCSGARAWLTVGFAIRVAQALGLQYELDLDDEPMSRSLALSSEAAQMGIDSSRRACGASTTSEEDPFVEQEIRRRTFWSCYIMDRYLSSGKYRPQMLRAKELRIQLPASERSFLFGEKVRTLMLGEEQKCVIGRAEVQSHRQATVILGTCGTPEPHMAPSPKSLAVQESDEDKVRLEIGSDEGLVSRYIKILEIYGHVVKWSCAGGRRIEEHPPWEPQCEWHRLRRMCLDFKASLPRQHALTTQNTQAHISLKTSTPYALVHTVYLLCQIMLHREYVPFIPIRCSKPQGPLDPPMFPSDKYNIPEGFWEDSAMECFKAAREIMDLVRSCQEWNVLVETPIVGFAVYTVAFVGVYCINFPWMDKDGYMCTQPSSAPALRPDGSDSGESKGFEAARKALEMIGQMRPRLHMADGWFKTINRMHRYFRRMKADYSKNVKAMESTSDEGHSSPDSQRRLSLREGGLGGGLDEFKILERTLQEFGNLEDHDIEMTDIGQHPGAQPLEVAYDDSNSGTPVKSEETGDRAVSTAERTQSESGPWNAINVTPGATAAGHQSNSSTPISAQFRSYGSYPEQQKDAIQQQQPPTQSSYGPHINNFRPAYSHNTMTPSADAARNLTSPTSHNATTVPQSSSPFDRRTSQQYASGWTTQNTSYPMQPPAAYPNGVPPHSHPTTPMQGVHAYPTPTPNHQPQQQLQPVPYSPEQPQQVWDLTQKEAWLNSLDTRLGGDDLAAFAEGGELTDWASISSARGYDPGWLSAIWSVSHD